MSDVVTPESWLALTTRLLLSEGLHPRGVPVSWGLKSLQGLAQELDTSLEDLIQEGLSQNPQGKLCQQIREALLDTRSSFFIPYSTYRYLRCSVLPSLTVDHSKDHTLRFWCASCGPGQEVYSIAIMLDVAMPELQDWDIQIIGTDVSRQAIAQAKAGKYSSQEVQQGLPEKLRHKYFEQSSDGFWSVNKAIQKRTTFQVQNVLRATEMPYDFDIIFFRRTLGQLDPRVRGMAIESLMKQAKPSTLLVTGTRELLPSNSFNLTEREPNSGYWEIPPEAQSRMKMNTLDDGEVLNSKCPLTEIDIKRLKKLLLESELFENIPGPLLDSICAKFELHEVKVGDTLIQQGKKNEAFFIVYEGSLPVVYNRGILRKTLELGQLFPGAIFGEMSLLLNQPANATIRADEEAFVFVGSAGLFKFLQDKDSAFREFVQTLQENRQAENTVTIETSGNSRAVDSYQPGDDGFELGLSLESLSDELIEAAPVSSVLMRRLKLRGGSQLRPTDEDFVRLNSIVRSTRLFHGLEVGKIDAIMRQIQLWRFEERSRIVKQNESGLGLFFIDRGSLQIEINRKLFKPGQAIQKIGSGSFFGELSILSGLPTCADVVSETPTRIYVMSKKLYMLLSTLNWDFRDAISAVAKSRSTENQSIV
ncbi:MAG: cyclic nucleotide-binding domain-containing protein [Deltaproteobacteria bacterium]|jgi:chemotaxis protein methyltransferase CheR|nr:cyclic nucleotide-binding domain-containing protein [Deltaproteobacteria bacterium]MBT6435838.1 cyclic nucleotide-binding domain-containing protein [Deltaproteobacteria bacterium]MBT6490775.1 cyclic nucleotide-binding domain-containing protein [Deltaproteobacteria bacterium]